MKYRHKESGKMYSEDEMKKMMSAKGYKKADYEEMGDESEEEEEGEKSLVSEDELKKSADALETVMQASDRKGHLLSKAQTGEITDEEQAELVQVLGGAQESLADEVAKSWEADANESFEKALDVSDYLNAQHEANVESLRELAGAMEKSDTRAHEFRMVFAKSLVDLSKSQIETHGLLNKIAERIGAIEAAPARAPRAAGTTAVPLAKSFAGQPSEEGKLSKSQIQNTLGRWIEGGKQVSRNGEALVQAAGHHEMTNEISESLYQEIKEEVRSR